MGQTDKQTNSNFINIDKMYPFLIYGCKFENWRAIKLSIESFLFLSIGWNSLFFFEIWYIGDVWRFNLLIMGFLSDIIYVRIRFTLIGCRTDFEIEFAALIGGFVDIDFGVGWVIGSLLPPLLIQEVFCFRRYWI